MKGRGLPYIIYASNYSQLNYHKHIMKIIKNTILAVCFFVISVGIVYYLYQENRIDCSVLELDYEGELYCADHANSANNRIYWAKKLLSSLEDIKKTSQSLDYCKVYTSISMLNDNIGVEYLNLHNNIEAFNYINTAAKMGNSLSQYRLGAMYTNGSGVDINNVEAYAWVTVALYQGIPDVSGDKDINRTVLNLQKALLHDLKVADIIDKSFFSKETEAKTKAAKYKEQFIACS